MNLSPLDALVLLRAANPAFSYSIHEQHSASQWTEAPDIKYRCEIFATPAQHKPVTHLTGTNLRALTDQMLARVSAPVPDIMTP